MCKKLRIGTVVITVALMFVFGFPTHAYAGANTLSAAAISSDGTIAVDASNFPDVAFRNWINQNCAGGDNLLTLEEIKNIHSMNISKKNIRSLEGIQYFTALTMLDCSYNPMDVLDLNGFTSLQVLICKGLLMSQSVVSANAKTLSAYQASAIKQINLQGCRALKQLDCSNNGLSSLDLRDCGSLESLKCSSNDITRLTLAQCKKLTKLDCSNNALNILDISKLRQLKQIYVSNNPIRRFIDRSGKILAVPTLNAGHVSISKYSISSRRMTLKFSPYEENTFLYWKVGTSIRGSENSIQIVLNKNLTVRPVCNIMLKSIYFSSNGGVLALGEKYKLTPRLDPGKPSNAKLFFISSNPMVASVDQKGVVTALKRGKVTIIVKSLDGSNLTARFQLAVEGIKAKKLTISTSTKTISMNERFVLSARTVPRNATFNKVTWRSNRSDIAKVSRTGEVKGVRPGVAIITATTVEGKQVQCRVTVAT